MPDILRLADNVRDALLRANARLFGAVHVQDVPIEGIQCSVPLFKTARENGAEVCHMFRNVNTAPAPGGVVPNNNTLENMLLLHNTCEDASIPIFNHISEALARGEEVTCGELFRVARVEIVHACLYTAFFPKSVSFITKNKLCAGDNVTSALVITHPPDFSEISGHRWCRVFDTEGRCVNIDPTIEQYPPYTGPASLTVTTLDGSWSVNVRSTNRRRRWIWFGTDLGNSGLPLFKPHVGDVDFVKSLSKKLQKADPHREVTLSIHKEVVDALRL